MASLGGHGPHTAIILWTTQLLLLASRYKKNNNIQQRLVGLLMGWPSLHRHSPHPVYTHSNEPPTSPPCPSIPHPHRSITTIGQTAKSYNSISALCGTIILITFRVSLSLHSTPRQPHIRPQQEPTVANTIISHHRPTKNEAEEPIFSTAWTWRKRRRRHESSSRTVPNQNNRHRCMSLGMGVVVGGGHKKEYSL